MRFARLLWFFVSCCCLGVRAAESVPDLLIEALLDYERYAETAWHDAPAPANSGYFGDGISGGNAGIRGTCGTALAYAVLLTEFPRDGESERRLRRVEAALRYASGTHTVLKHATCVDGKNWGYGWQTALWSGSMGFACSLVQDRLPRDLVADCQRVVATEADRLAKIAPPSGSRGDSKAEENAWNSNALALAAAWVPNGNRDAWLSGAKRYLANTYTVPEPGDDPLRDWITTANLLPSFAMENHGFFHPTYQMVSGMSLGDSLLMAERTSPATGQELRPFAEHNVLPTWRCLEQVLLDSGELAYPSGLDWSLHGYGQVSYYAWLATHFQNGEAHWACERLVRLMRQRQTINGDGRFTGESCRNGFYREAVGARRAAIALLHYRQAKTLPEPTAPLPHVAHLPDVKLILQRSEKGFFGISYGSRVMAVVHPTAAGYGDAPYVTTPLAPGLLTVDGRLPRSAEIHDVATDDDGFACTLDLSDRFLSATRVRVVGTGDSLALLEVPGGDVPATPPLVFPVGIENHPLTGPARTIRWTGGELRVPERSGERHVLVPAASVSERFGMVAGPDGDLVYVSPTGYNRSGAAEDVLALQPAVPQAPRYAIVLPDADLATVERVRQSVRFGVKDEMAVLRYRTPGGRDMELALSSRSPVPPFSRLHVPCTVKVANHHQEYPGENMVDGDPTTFWVSSKDGVAVVPGNGPTPENPERVEVTFLPSRVGGVLIAPRPRYGPRRLTVTVGGTEAFAGTMGDTPLLIRLKAPVEAESVVLTITQSHDPSHPDNTRNVQIAEISLLKTE
jgi:hypothetical protein